MQVVTATSVVVPISQERKSGTDRFHRPELDVLRFVAFLMVFMHHSFSGNGGRILRSIRDAGAFGVCLFFLLSSYLITELLRREQLRTGDIHIKAFYVRRILRIWPLYFFMLLLGYVAGKVGFTVPLTFGRLVAFALLAGNWYTGIFGYIGNFIFPLWSISLEEQFYLLWPTIMRAGRKRGIIIAGVVFWATSFLVLAILIKLHASLNEAIWTNTLVQFQFFALGGLLAVFLDGRMPRISGYRIPLLLMGGLSYFVADSVFDVKRADAIATMPTTIPGYFMLGIGTVLIFVGVLGVELPKFSKPFIYLGKISYGLYAFQVLGNYLAHWSLKHIERLHRGSILVMPTALILTIAMASVSYKFIESPFLKLKERFTFIHSRSV